MQENKQKKKKSILDGNHCKRKKTLKIINATMFPGEQSGPEPQKMQSPDKPKKTTKKKTRGWERVCKNIQKDSLQSCATKLFEEGAKISHYHKNKRSKVWKINMVALSSWLMSMELTDNFTADKNRR